MAQTDDLSDGFFDQLKPMCARIGCDPVDMLKVMFSEGGVSATAHNRASDASGLIQFIPSTLRGLGWTGSNEAFRRLSAEEQLPWVEKFFEPWQSKGLTTVTRVYQAVFLPASLDAGSSDETVVCGAQGPFAAAYAANRSVDGEGKGFISVRDLRAAVEARAQGPRWDEILRRLGTPVDPRPRPGDGQTVYVNGIAPGFDGFRLPNEEMLQVDTRALFPMVPRTAQAVIIELFRQAGRVEVFHGSGLYAGQVGWGGLPYLQLRVELANNGCFSIKGSEDAALQRMGILGFTT
jgi:hypothetical protein